MTDKKQNSGDLNSGDRNTGIRVDEPNEDLTLIEVLKKELAHLKADLSEAGK